MAAVGVLDGKGNDLARLRAQLEPEGREDMGTGRRGSSVRYEFSVIKDAAFDGFSVSV